MFAAYPERPPSGAASRAVRRRDDATGLQAEPEPLAVLAAERVQAGQLAHAVEAVGDGVAMHEDGRRRGDRRAVLLDPRAQRRHEVGAVLLVVARERRDRVLVEGPDL